MSNTLLSALVTKLDNKIAASKTNGFFSTAQKEAAINTSGERVCNFRSWKCLEDSKKTTSVANQEYYDEPDEFQADSIYAMKIDGEPYDKKDWMDFQDYIDNESEDKVFATHDGLYFINPVPDESNLELCLYGIKKWVTLASGDASILPPKFDEAIVMLAFAECLDKKKEYSAAAVIRKQVEEPANPQVQGSGGLLARIGEREDDGGKSGSVGKAASTRFL